MLYGVRHYALAPLKNGAKWGMGGGGGVSINVFKKNYNETCYHIEFGKKDCETK